jgi:hypothetical protein
VRLCSRDFNRAPLLQELADDPARLPGSTPSASTSTSGTTGHAQGKDRRNSPGSWTDQAQRSTEGTAAGPGAGPVGKGLRRLADRSRRAVHRRGRRGDTGSVPWLWQRDQGRARRRHRRTRRIPRRETRTRRDGGDPPPGPARTTRSPRPQTRPALQDPQHRPRRCRAAHRRQIERLETGLQAGDPDYAATVAWR